MTITVIITTTNKNNNKAQMYKCKDIFMFKHSLLVLYDTSRSDQLLELRSINNTSLGININFSFAEIFFNSSFLFHEMKMQQKHQTNSRRSAGCCESFSLVNARVALRLVAERSA